MVYVGVLLAVLLATVLGLAFVHAVQIQTAGTAARASALEAQYLAESAAHHAMWLSLRMNPGSVARRIAAGSDDASEDAAGTVRLTHTLDYVPLGQETMVGLRFANVDVPQGAVIASAEIEFFTAMNSQLTDLLISGEAADDAATFRAIPHDLTDRPTTIASVPWINIPPWKNNAVASTPDLAAVVEEIVQRESWTRGNALVFLFRSLNPAGLRRFLAYEWKPSDAAVLKIRYSREDPGPPDQYTMHSFSGGRYGYKIRPPTENTLAAIATVGAVRDAVVHQSYVLYVRLHRRALRILNPGAALADYPVRVTLTPDRMGDLYEEVEADGSDVRFETAGGEPLDFWIEHWDPIGTSTLWVEASNLPTGETLLYMTYGDPSAPGGSDGTATFDYFEDFEGYSPGSSPGDWLPSGTYLIAADGGALVLDDGVSAGEAVIAGTGDWADTAVRQRFRSLTGDVDYAGLALHYVDAGNLVYGGYARPSGGLMKASIWERVGGAWEMISPAEWDVPDPGTEWHVQELAAFNDGVGLWIDDAFLGHATLGVGAPNAGQTGFWSQYNNVQGYRDWHLVRKYREPEPSAELL